jgi:hypothetical protein
MALTIKREGTTRFDSVKPENEVSTQQKASIVKSTSQVQETGDSAQQARVAKNLANAKKFDGQLQAMSQNILLKDRLLKRKEPSDAPSAYNGASHTQQLGKSGNAVSQSYADQKDEGSKTENPNSYGSIRRRIADSLGVAESDPAVMQEYQRLATEQKEKDEAERLSNAQKILDDARTLGRRIETTNPETGIKSITEYIPGEWTENIGDMKYFIRKGIEMTLNGDHIKRMEYLDPTGVRSLGFVESLIEGDKETVTKVIENVPGSIGLKEGDTRDIPPEVSSAAGKVPSSFDPVSGNYGTAGKSNNPSDQTSSGNGDAKTEYQPLSREDRGQPTVYFGGTYESSQTKSKEPETATEAEPKKESKGHQMHKGIGNVPGNTNGEWEEGPSEWTETPPTQVEVEEPETDEGLEEEAETNQNDDDSHAAFGDFADPGPEVQSNVPARTEVETGSNQNRRWTAEGSVGIIDRPGGPVDYGNPNDANAANSNIDSFTISSLIGHDPTVTDPANPGEDGEMGSLDQGSIHSDMSGTLRDGGNPLDPRGEIAPAPNRPKTSDAENPSGGNDGNP